jgi:hypothetical protein
MEVRVFQPTRDVKRLGKRKASWHIEWRDPLDGRKRSSKVGTKKEADDAAEVQRQKLVAQRHGLKQDYPWANFVEEYKVKYIDKFMVSEESRIDARRVLDRFTRLANPSTVASITEKVLDTYVGTRSQERGQKKGDVVAAATIRKELRPCEPH